MNLRSYVLHFERYAPHYSEERVLVVNANSKSEAIGFGLNEIEDSHISEFTAYGGESDGEAGIVYCLLNAVCEP